MNEKSEQSEMLTDSLAEGIAAVMAASDVLEAPQDPTQGRADDMAELFLGELNRLWVEQPAEYAA